MFLFCFTQEFDVNHYNPPSQVQPTFAFVWDCIQLAHPAGNENHEMDDRNGREHGEIIQAEKPPSIILTNAGQTSRERGEAFLCFTEAFLPFENIFDLGDGNIMNCFLI